MPRARTSLLLLVAPALVAGAGCGGGSATSTGTAVSAVTATTTTASGRFDRQIADAGVLRLGDVPAGWKAARQPPDDPLSSCPAVKRARTTLSARARSPEFGDPQEREFAQSAIYVYRDADTAHRAWVGLSSPTTRSCLARLVAKGLKQGLAASGSATHVGSPTSLTVRTAPLGDERAAARITIPLTVKGTTVDATVDLIFVHSGRGIASNTFISVGPQFDGRLEYTLHKLVVDRMNAGLAS